jgi:membrane protease subunit (stomatin/prohibitin family)
MGIMWGTDSKVNFLDPTLGVPFAIGAHGHLNLQVTDSRKLLVKLVGTMNGIAWEERGQGFTKSLGASFKPMISTAVKAHLASSIKEKKINLLEIDENLEILSEALRVNISSNFEEYGLSVPQFYIKEVGLPEDDPNFKKLREIHSLEIAKRAEQALRERKLEEETTETELEKRRLERELLNAQLEAQKTKLQGFAEAEVMQAQGYNQKDVLQAEVQKAYAEGIGNMTINGSGGNIAGDMIGLSMGMAMAGAVTPQVDNMFSAMSSTNADTTKSSGAKCTKCGADLPENAKFCLECGEKVVADGMIVCPECGNTVAKGKFCPECGHKFVTACPKCGTELASGTKFCPECGEKL